MSKRGKLSDLEKKIMIEKYHDGFSVEELAQYLDRSEKQVYSFLSDFDNSLEPVKEPEPVKKTTRSVMQKQMNPRKDGEKSRAVTIMDPGSSAMADRDRTPKKAVMDRFSGVMHTINAKSLDD